jgi:hypothetical protein
MGGEFIRTKIMAKILAITDYIDSLAEAEARFGLTCTDDSTFFPEWTQLRPKLIPDEQRNELYDVLCILNHLKTIA